MLPDGKMQFTKVIGAHPFWQVIFEFDGAGGSLDIWNRLDIILSI